MPRVVDRVGRRLRASVGPGLAVLAVLAVFEVLARGEVLSPRALPPMTTTFRVLAQEATTAAFWNDIGDTMLGWATGLGIAVVVAVPLGMLLASVRPLFHATSAIIEFLRPIPSVALIPLAVLVYGTGFETKVFLVVFGAVWPLLFQTIYGVQSVDAVARDTVRAFGLGRFARVRWLVLPSAAPYVATGLRISSSVALILAVTTEIVVGAPGIGRTINIARSSAAVPLTYALIIVAGLLGWFVNSTFTYLERRALHWLPSGRSS